MERKVLVLTTQPPPALHIIHVITAELNRVFTVVGATLSDYEIMVWHINRRKFRRSPVPSCGRKGEGFIQSLFSDSGFRPNSLLTLSFDGIQCLLYLRGVMARAD